MNPIGEVFDRRFAQAFVLTAVGMLLTWLPCAIYGRNGFCANWVWTIVQSCGVLIASFGSGIPFQDSGFVSKLPALALLANCFFLFNYWVG